MGDLLARKITPDLDRDGMRDPVAVPVDSLTTKDSPRLAGVNMEHVRALTEIADQLPPIVVHRSTMRVIDGAHRLQAARLLGRQTIDVRFFDGDEAATFVVAVQLNVKHGMPLSLPERTAAATRILRSHPQWSDRMIASIVGLSPKTVGAVRARSGEDVRRSDERVGLDGRVRRAGRGGTGTDAARQEVLQDKAEASSPDEDRADSTVRGPNPEPPGVHHDDVDPARQRRSRQRIARPPDLTTDVPTTGAGRSDVVSLLRRDPSLRFSEGGRLLLRLLETSTMDQRLWDQMVHSMPAHHLETVVALARECAVSWHTFADRLTHQPPGEPAG
jgi:ParB-like chromosome segregation protein Spo0J